MPNAFPNTAIQTDFGEEESGANATGLYIDLRSKYSTMMSTLFDKERLSSETQVEQLTSWLDSIEGNAPMIQEAHKNFQQHAIPLMREQLSQKSQAMVDLQVALANNEISQQSYTAWIAWIEDTSRDSDSKIASIGSTLPDYLANRRALAIKRQGILKDRRLADMENSADPTLQGLVAKISDHNYFLETLDFDGRKDLITDVLNAFPLLSAERTLFAGFEKELESAVQNKLISADSKKKWIARFMDPTVNMKAKEYFVKSQFPSYVAAWKKVHKERDALVKDPTLKLVTEKDWKQLGVFTDDTKFRALHFDAKEGLVAEARAAITAHKEGKLVLHKETRSVLQSAAAAGYISKNKIGPWTEHVLSGERSLAELKNFIKDWAKVRFRYDKVEATMLKERVPQGLQRLSEEKFLALTYEQRASYVNEAERRLHIQNSNPKDTPFQDAKGKVRHALDTENWEEARFFLSKAWPLAESSEDNAELQSMEKLLKSFGDAGDSESSSEDAAKEIAWAREEIDTVMALLPPSYQKLYSKALVHGAACLQCVTTCVYNRTWCQERGYLTEGLEDRLRSKSIEETEARLRPSGPGHGDGYENNFVDGFKQPAIRPKGIGPQNVFSSGSAAGAFVDEANANKNCWSFWYWTNYIDKDVSAGKNAYVSYNLNHRIKRAARALDRHGMTYHSVGPLSSLN